MSNYAKIRNSCRGSGGSSYANGGRVKNSRTIVNVVQPPASGAGSSGGPQNAAAGAGPAGGPPRPVPPVAANAALGAMGAQPIMKNGGRVKGGAGGGLGRLQKARAKKE